MLHAARPLHGVHDGAADVHASSPVLRAPLRDVHDLQVSVALRSPSGSVLHDPLCAALRLPAGPGAGLLPGPRSDMRRPGDVCGAGHVCGAGDASRS